MFLQALSCIQRLMKEQKMVDSELLYASFLLFGVFISSVSQVLLKKAANRKYNSFKEEYLNPLVISAYAIFVCSTLLSILAYKKIPLSMGPILETTSYLYITFFGVKIFHEKLTRMKLIALLIIIAGIVVYSV